MKQHVSQPLLHGNAESRDDRQHEAQPAAPSASGEEPKLRAGRLGHISHRLGSRALAATSSVPLAQTGAPLSFSSWFACQAHLLDIKLLTLELIVINLTNLPKVIFKLRCLPVAGSLHAAFQDAFLPPTHPYAARADARLASFPCAAPHPQQLLHAVVSGALTDPWVRVRTGDYGNLALIVTQLLAILVAVLLPRAYVRVRHWLLFAVNAALLVGAAASVAWTPAALLPVGAASHLGHYWGSIMVLYLAWKSVYVLRVPASHQLLFGLLLWLMTMAVMPAVRTSLYPEPAASVHDVQGDTPSTTTRFTHQPQHYKGRVSLLQQLLQGPALWTAVLSFIVMVVLPYVIARAWERATLWPRYRAYVTAVTEAAVAGGTNRGGCRTQQADGGGAEELQDRKDAMRSNSQPAGGAQRSRAASRGSGGSPRGEEAGPSTATPAAGADADGAGCRNGNSAHSAADPLEGGTSTRSAPKTAGLPSALSVGDGGGTRGVSRSVAGAAAATADTASAAPCANSPTKATYATSNPMHQGSEQQEQQQQRQQQHDPERREQSRQADGGSVSSPHHPDTSAPLLHSLHPRHPWLDIGLLMPAAASHNTASLDSSRLRLNVGGSASGSGIVNTSIAVHSGSRSSPCSPLYGNLSPYRTKALSVKVPLRRELGSGASQHDSFPAASARVVNAVNAAIARHNAAAAAAAAVASSATGALVGAVGQAPDAAASSLEGTLPRVVPLSCVCVEGCVHLLLLVQEHAGGGYGAAELDVDQLQQHAGMDIDGAGGAVMQHATIGFGSSWGANGAGEERGLEVDMDAAVEAAVLGMLNQGTADRAADGIGGSGGLGCGGAAGLAAVWPPAVAADDRSNGRAPVDVTEAGSAAAPAGPEEGRDAADSGAEVVVACGSSLLRGLEAVRCVVAGQGAGVGAAAELQLGSGGGVEPFGQGPERGRVYLDCIVPVAVEAEQQQQQLLLPQGEGEAAAAAAERVTHLRLQLPRSALLSPGVLALHLLPPPPTSTPPDHPAPVPSGPPPAHYFHPHAPLCFLPLLVLPATAAREVAQLHAYAVARELGWGQEGQGFEEGMEQLQQGLVEGDATYTTRVSDMLTGARGCVAAGAAAAALHGNGMYSLSFDFGALLDLPYNTARGGAPSPDPRVFSGVLRLLAEQGMGACLRMGQGAMQRAGVRLEAGDGGAAGMGAGVRAPAEDHGISMGAMRGASVEGPSGAGDQGLLVQGSLECEQQQDTQDSPFRTPGSVPEAHGQGSILVDTAHVRPFAQASCKGTTAGAGPSVPRSPDHSTPPPLQHPLLPAPPPHGPNWRWWLRTLLLGFQPAGLEATYQRTFKAARCCACDCAALALHVAAATVSGVRTARNGGEHGGGQQDADCAAGVCGVHTCPPSVGARGGYDPQLASQVLWMGGNLLSLLLMALTPLHARHRNAALLLRGLFSAAALTAITWTAPVAPETAVGILGGAASHTRPWFLVPDGWVINCQRYSLHWLLFSLWDPAMLQLSLPLQAVVSAVYLVPAALLQLRVHPAAAAAAVGEGHGGGGGSGGNAAARRAAVVYAVGTAVCGLVISAVTDLAGRLAFMEEQQRRGTARGSSSNGRDGMQWEHAGAEVVQKAEISPKAHKGREGKDGARVRGSVRR